MRNQIKDPKVPRAVREDPRALEALVLEKITVFCAANGLTFSGEKTVTSDGKQGIVIEFTTNRPAD